MEGWFWGGSERIEREEEMVDENKQEMRGGMFWGSKEKEEDISSQQEQQENDEDEKIQDGELVRGVHQKIGQTLRNTWKEVLSTLTNCSIVPHRDLPLTIPAIHELERKHGVVSEMIKRVEEVREEVDDWMIEGRATTASHKARGQINTANSIATSIIIKKRKW